MFSTTAKTGCVQDRALALVFPRIAVISPLIVSSLLRSRFNIEAKWIFLKYKPDSKKKKKERKYKPDSVPTLLKMLW